MNYRNKIVAAGAEEEATFTVSEDALSTDSRSHEKKRLTTLRVGTITVGGRRELCLIRNVSGGGLRAHVYSPVSEGEAVSVELKTNQQTSGTITWVQDGSIGVQFDEPIDVEGLLASQNEGDHGWSSRMPRAEVDRLGELRVGARIYPINTRDISQGGVRVEIDHPLRVGDQVVLTLQKWRPIEGVVRWYQEDQGGVAFNQVVPFKELMEWLKS